ncbi:MAG: tail fiber domain-containing protein [Bacteroidota bacterium]|nr:tail fiber domain-containing protein [Bacteroidota bacterium]
MKTFKLTIIIALVVFGAGNAQMKVIPDGSTYLNGYRSTDDPNNEVAVQVYGNYGAYLAGGRLSFGDYGTASNGGGNAFVGEYGTWDSDIVQLHGKLGIYLTKNTGSVLGYYHQNSGNKFTFYCDVYSYGTKLTSDERFKTDINSISNSLLNLVKLNGVSYKYDYSNMTFENSRLPYSTTTTSNTLEMSEKEKEYMANLENIENQENANSPKRLGFIAQDLQEVFPELVEHDSSGYYYVDYIGLIPVIVEAIKEQQSIIDAQSLKIKELEEQTIEIITSENTSNLKGLIASTEIIDNDKIINAVLFQNSPNPFSENTEIKYLLPEEVRSASIYIYNMQGNQIKNIPVHSRGKATETIYGSDLAAGMYLYTLIADGKEVSTKRMILTE